VRCATLGCDVEPPHGGPALRLAPPYKLQTPLCLVPVASSPPPHYIPRSCETRISPFFSLNPSKLYATATLSCALSSRRPMSPPGETFSPLTCRTLWALGFASCMLSETTTGPGGTSKVALRCASSSLSRFDTVSYALPDSLPNNVLFFEASCLRSRRASLPIDHNALAGSTCNALL